MERVQPVMRGGPAEQEDPVCPEEAVPEGGSGAALPVPGEHTHSGASLQQPCLPPGMEPWALVSGERARGGVMSLVPRGQRRWQKSGCRLPLPPSHSAFTLSWESP